MSRAWVACVLAGAMAVVSAGPSWAQDVTAHKLELTRRYFSVINMGASVKPLIDAMRPQLIEQQAKLHPEMTADQRKAVVDAVSEATNALVIRLTERMAPIYAQALTEKELEDLLAFYEGPSGRSILAKGPQLSAQMAPTLTQLMPEFSVDVQRRVCVKLGCEAQTAATGKKPGS